MDDAVMEAGFASHPYFIFGIKGEEDVTAHAFVDSEAEADTLSVEWVSKGIADRTEIWTRWMN